MCSNSGDYLLIVWVSYVRARERYSTAVLVRFCTPGDAAFAKQMHERLLMNEVRSVGPHWLFSLTANLKPTVSLSSKTPHRARGNLQRSCDRVTPGPPSEFILMNEYSRRPLIDRSSYLGGTYAFTFILRHFVVACILATAVLESVANQAFARSLGCMHTARSSFIPRRNATCYTDALLLPSSVRL
jgi:hypothetical protein